MYVRPLLLAHQGGWDEFLLVAAPLALFTVAVWTAKRRASVEAGAHRPGDGRDDQGVSERSRGGLREELEIGRRGRDDQGVSERSRGSGGHDG